MAARTWGNAAWNQLVFQREEFTIEGSPTGWNRIDGIRLSPCRGHNTDTIPCADHLCACDPTPWVVRGTLSEQVYGVDVDRYCEVFMSRLYQYDVPYALTTDEGVAAGVVLSSPNLGGGPDDETVALYRGPALPVRLLLLHA